MSLGRAAARMVSTSAAGAKIAASSPEVWSCNLVRSQLTSVPNVQKSACVLDHPVGKGQNDATAVLSKKLTGIVTLHLGDNVVHL
eukprot:1744684-Amphidinium_carterae.1